jgi:hypothetical protein
MGKVGGHSPIDRNQLVPALFGKVDGGLGTVGV